MKETNLCSPYSFPKECLSLFSSEQRIILIEGKITGVAGKFFKHKFYFLLDPQNNNQLIMDWGGDPKNPYFALHQYKG